MSITLPLKDMTVEEKRRLMETLWDDLSRNAERLQPPAVLGFGPVCEDGLRRRVKDELVIAGDSNR
jgi:hypothetical protein